MEQDASQVILNIGCGAKKLIGAINVDAYGQPDVLHDLCRFPWPFDNASADRIVAHHVFEHLSDWWGAFMECTRILKVGGMLDMRVPHHSSDSALGYRDHLHVFTRHSFHGTEYASKPGTNSWAAAVDILPMSMTDYGVVPYKRYNWMLRWCPWLLSFCGNHLRGFIWEQRFLWKKTKEYAV
jgi:SAM-dependent methyltransferase